MDRILIRMPDDFDYFLPAAAVAQSYIAQQYHQAATKQKSNDLHFLIEVGDESHLFFAPMFPRFDMTVREQEEIKRADWDNVIDMRDIGRAYDVATTNEKPITEAWSVIFGASASRLPSFGCLAARGDEPHCDIVIDKNIWTDALGFNIADKFTSLVSPIDFNQRPAQVFDAVANAKIVVGRASGATYIAACLGRGLLEIHSSSFGSWFLNKGLTEGYAIYKGDGYSAYELWPGVEKLCNLLNTNSQEETLTAV